MSSNLKWNVNKIGTRPAAYYKNVDETSSLLWTIKIEDNE